MTVYPIPLLTAGRLLVRGIWGGVGASPRGVTIAVIAFRERKTRQPAFAAEGPALVGRGQLATLDVTIG